MIRVRNIFFALSILVGVLLVLPVINTCERFEPAGELSFYTDTITMESRAVYKFSGAIVNLGKEKITQHGFCWSNSENPTVDQDSSTRLGIISAPGKFSSTVSGMVANTTYFVRVYATTDAGTEYSKEKSFTTPAPTLPVVTTTIISSITHDSAQSGGNITDDGGSPVTARGVCWATTANPTVTSSHTTDGNGIGTFTSSLSGLSCSTTYFIRAYATNSVGTGYGDTISFTTSDCPVGLPIVTTTEVSNVTDSSAQSGGNIADEGESTVTARGVCWSTSQNPTISDNNTTDGAGTGSFASSITGLSCGTTYYVRAYATNSIGTGYGDTISFTTANCPVGLPTLTTSEVTNITANSAQSGGDISNEGGSTVTVRGVCWSTSQDPTISDNKTIDGTGAGSYTSSITGLASKTTFYVRAYATNNQGTAYGNEVNFTTHISDGETVTDYDGNVYQIVQIGDQIWMKENLKVIHYADGTTIPLVESISAWEALGYTDKAYCWYDNSTSNRDIYGGLYTWGAAMKGASSSDTNPSGVQGVCPDGWHLPADSEWKQLEMHLGMSQEEADNTGYRGTDEGGKLKETGFLHWSSPNTGATNSSGFTALPSGSRGGNGGFDDIDILGGWWSSSESGPGAAWHRYVVHTGANVYRNFTTKNSGFSVRCIMGEGSPNLPMVTTDTPSSITDSSAQSGGEVTSDGGATVTARGVCWSTSQNPTTADDHTSDGSGTGTFTSSISGIECGTTYYVRAYATNSVGTAYGFQESFTTNQCPVVNLPTVTTVYFSNITNTSADGGGDVTDDGGGTITASGVCWSTSQNPTISDSHTTDGTGVGSFISNVSQLTKSTTYYFRAYATNSAGTSYGDEVVLRTYEGTITDYDGNEYWTVLIGDQKWMVENLNVTHYADGSAIPLVENNPEWDALEYTDKAYCWYDNNTSNGNTYGALYTWAAASGDISSNTNPSGVQGACPAGWHLPSDAEWKQLEIHLGMSQSEADKNYDWRGTDEGNKLKEAGNSHWINYNMGASNESGFTAIPGGIRARNGSFSRIEDEVFYHSSTEEGGGGYIARSLSFDQVKILSMNFIKDGGYSVRCVEGQGNSVPTLTTTAVSNITETTADAGGNITDNGGQPVTERGVCWSTAPEPTIDDNKTIDGSGTGSFSSSLTGLSPNTTYYIRAYSTNIVGIGYGQEISFATLEIDSTVTDYDGNVYPTIQIGDQLWMKENLKVRHFADGTPIILVEINAYWDTLDYSDKVYCWYENSTVNRDTYGGLYTWAAAVNGSTGSSDNPSGIQGVCPDGWHLPSSAEWRQLEIYLGMNPAEPHIRGYHGTDEGGKLKEAGTAHWVSPNEGATNESGFTALPGGYRINSGTFGTIGYEGRWWSTTEPNAFESWYRYLSSNSSAIGLWEGIKNYGFSVRCVRD